MDDTTKSIIERISRRYEKPRVLENGLEVTLYFDCLALTPNDLARLAVQAVGHLEHESFDIAVGLAFEGILFAAAIAGGKSVAILREDGTVFGPGLKDKRVVVVSDIVCTGRRLRIAEDRLVQSGAKVVGCACIIDRSSGQVGTANKPLWSAFQTSQR